MFARLSAQFLQVVFQGLAEHVAALCELLDLAGDKTVDAGPRIRQLARSASSARVRMSRPSRELLDLAGDEPVDAGPALGQLGEIVFERTGENVAAFGELLDLAGDQAVDAGSAFGELGRDPLRARVVRISRPSASFSTWPATSPSMPDRRFGELVRDRLPARA